MTEPTRHERMVAAAVHLARAGYRIGWASSTDGKAPRRHWRDDATDDPALVPGLLHGPRNSLVIPAGDVLVIDVDDPVCWDALEQAGLPEGLRVATPTAGHGHAYGRVPAGFDTATIPGTFVGGEIRRFDPGTDTASMVVGPWSQTPAGVYQVLGRAREIPELPISLLEYLHASARRQSSSRNDARGPGDPDWFITAGRHDFLVGRARRLRGVGLTGERLLEEIVRLDHERCRPPLAETDGRGQSELESIVGWVMKNIGDDRPVSSSANGDVPAGSQRTELRFRTARELLGEAPRSDDTRYVARPWLVRGTITELDGRPKLSGKTTLVLDLIRCVLDGAPFLGEATERTPVVLLTEQSRRSIRPKLRALELDRDDLLVLSGPDAAGAAWPGIVAAAGQVAADNGAGLLVVDTLPAFAGIRGEAENDAGAAIEAMVPLQVLAAELELAVLVTRHDRKGGGEIGESGRGSNAWTGAVDCVVGLRRQATPLRPTIRVLEAISRRDDVPEGPLVIELVDGAYLVLGDEPAVARDETRRQLLELMADGQTRTEKAMLEAIEGVARTTLQLVRSGLVEEGLLVRLDRARANDAYRYRVPAPASVSLPAAHLGVGQRQTTTAPEIPGPAEARAGGLNIDPAVMWAKIDDEKTLQ